MGKRFILGVLAYLVPTFALAFVWHLLTFADYYASLHIYREDMIIPFGFGSMLVQGIVYALVYPYLFDGQGILQGGWKFGLGAGIMAWSYTVLPVAAKFPMTSVTGFVGIETAFTVVQFVLVGPLMAAAYRRPAPNITAA